MTTYKKEMDCYGKLNEIACKGEVVFFGSTFAKDIPVSELAQTFDLDCKIYNRSFQDLSVFDAEELVKECVLCLEPKKILLQLGETDLERGYKSISEIVAAYETLIKTVKKNKVRNIVIVSVCSDAASAQELNRNLEALARKYGCSFADVAAAYQNPQPEVKAFHMLKSFLRERLSFYDIMNPVNI